MAYEKSQPRLRCLLMRACASIICPHRNMQPQPMSDVGPTPPVAVSKQTFKKLDTGLRQADDWFREYSTFYKAY
jgi:hypothetical protein